MTSIQFLAVILIILILIKTLVDFKKNKITLSVFLFWLTFWSITLGIIVIPKVTSFLEDKLLGEGRGTDAIIYFSILFIFFILFKIIVRLEKIKQEITKIVRQLALKEFKEK
ncbi:unnamed protein product [marine sediment metagenome]|uniref:DUF2304 domain-containing protein n=1 Tax=marine sediment metagenome TaxID=412755 RepID=X0XDH8_9ZZZZ